MSEKKFVEGLFYKYPRTNAPAFVAGAISFNVAKFTTWFEQWKKDHPEDAWINVDIMESKNSGDPYCVLNEFKKSGMTENPVKQEEGPKDNIDPDSIPF